MGFDGVLADLDPFEERGDGTASGPERLLVTLVIVGRTVLPAAEDDALPFEAQSAHGGMVGGALLALLIVVGRRPAAV